MGQGRVRTGPVLPLLLTCAPQPPHGLQPCKIATWGSLEAMGAGNAQAPRCRQLAIVGVAEVSATGAGKESGAGAGLGSRAQITVGRLTAWLITISAS